MLDKVLVLIAEAQAIAATNVLYVSEVIDKGNAWKEMTVSTSTVAGMDFATKVEEAALLVKRWKIQGKLSPENLIFLRRNTWVQI
jgi:hypothetical protein